MFKYHNKKEGKDQELIQLSTTPDPGYQWESDNFTILQTRAKRKRSAQKKFEKVYQNLFEIYMISYRTLTLSVRTKLLQPNKQINPNTDCSEQTDQELFSKLLIGNNKMDKSRSITGKFEFRTFEQVSSFEDQTGEPWPQRQWFIHYPYFKVVCFHQIFI